MKTQASCLTVSILIALASAFFCMDAYAEKPKRKTISDGERASATWAVQNLMSRHEFMHAAGQNLEEIDSIWVSRSGPHAQSATFGSPGWVMNGIETIRRAYGQGSRADAEAARKALAEIDPKVKDQPEFFGAGAERVMHTSTTPVIEVAGDGRTAQGAWYSPGMGIMPKVENGKIAVQAMMFWEKYGADFVQPGARGRDLSAPAQALLHVQRNLQQLQLQVGPGPGIAVIYAASRSIRASSSG